jgi:ribosomal protein L15
MIGGCSLNRVSYKGDLAMPMRLGRTARALLKTANGKKNNKTVLVETGNKVIDGKRTSYTVLEARAAKKLVKLGYLQVLLHGKFEKFPMDRINGYWTGTATKYKITKAGQKALAKE